jgi:large subunit ribosomal protein L13
MKSMLRTYRTYSAKQGEVPYRWHVLDAANRPLGHLATEAARLLMGKHKPQYTRHVLTGDFVIVVNAAQVHSSGQKAKQKLYYRHSGYTGHLRQTPLEVMLERHPTRVIELAVKGMLPKNTLARQMLRRLKVYASDQHPHEAQVRAGEIRPVPKLKAQPRRKSAAPVEEQPVAQVEEVTPRPVRRRRAASAEVAEQAVATPRTTRRKRTPSAEEAPARAEATPRTTRRRRATASEGAPQQEVAPETATPPAKRRRTRRSEEKETE